MLEEVKMDCEITAADLCKNIEINHNNVNERTIQRFLNNNGIVARRMVKTNFISDKNKEIRVEWAEERENWNIGDFKLIYFSDESLVCCEK